MTGKELGAAMAAAHAKATGARRSIRLPDEEHIRFSATSDGLEIWMSDTAVTGNMQTNSAAFEGWVLAIWAWLGKRKTVLTWEEPATERQVSARHYHRFLYRISVFRTLFAEHFAVVDPSRLSRLEQLLARPVFLNTAGDGIAIEPQGGFKAEAALENALVNGEALKHAFGLESYDRQFPVGVFTEKVSASTFIFTGGKSAIDVVGTHADGSFWLFELKAEKNIQVGAISELLFYTAVLSAARAGRFRFNSTEIGARATVRPERLMSCRRLEACLLAPTHHPLLDKGRILELLNQAASRLEAGVPVRFRQAFVTPGDGGLRVHEERPG